MLTRRQLVAISFGNWFQYQFKQTAKRQVGQTMLKGVVVLLRHFDTAAFGTPSGSIIGA